MSEVILRVRTIYVSSKNKKKMSTLYHLFSYIMLGLGFSDIILRHFLALLSMFSELEHIYPQSLSINLGTQIGQKKKGTHALSPGFQKGPS